MSREVAFLDGFRRVLWQGSPDHRGTPERPGRVATVIREHSAVCSGLAFRIDPATAPRTLAELDQREQGGYQRAQVSLRFQSGASISALTYVGAPGNPHFLGAARQSDMLWQISRSVGPSGHNRDYVLLLADTLRQLALVDEEIESLADALNGHIASPGDAMRPPAGRPLPGAQSE